MLYTAEETQEETLEQKVARLETENKNLKAALAALNSMNLCLLSYCSSSDM